MNKDFSYVIYAGYMANYLMEEMIKLHCHITGNYRCSAH